jgi:hypothetical protein
MVREYIASCILEEKEDAHARNPIFTLPEDLPSNLILCAYLPSGFSGEYELKLCSDSDTQIGYLGLRGDHKTLCGLLAKNVQITYVDLRDSSLDANIKTITELYEQKEFINVLDLRGSTVVDKLNLYGGVEEILSLKIVRNGRDIDENAQLLGKKLSERRFARKNKKVGHKDPYQLVRLNEDETGFELIPAEGNEKQIFAYTPYAHLQSIAERLDLDEETIENITDQSHKVFQATLLFPEIDPDFHNGWDKQTDIVKYAALVHVFTHYTGLRLNPVFISNVTGVHERKIQDKGEKVAKWWEVCCEHIMANMDQYANEVEEEVEEE